MKKIIDVPYYSEFEKIDGSLEHQDVFKRRSCGIVSVKMVLDYYSGAGKLSSVKLKNLINSALRHHAYRLKLGGRRNYGWIHSGLVRTVQEFGYLSWRHAFFVRNSDIKNLKNENKSVKSINAYKNQVIDEAFLTFRKSIDLSEPFLVSIDKNLGKKVSPHLVVVTGYEYDGDQISGLYINDPNNPKKNGKRSELINQFISRRDFVKMWRKTAIFIRRNGE